MAKGRTKTTGAAGAIEAVLFHRALHLEAGVVTLLRANGEVDESVAQAAIDHIVYEPSKLHYSASGKLG